MVVFEVSKERFLREYKHHVVSAEFKYVNWMVNPLTGYIQILTQKCWKASGRLGSDEHLCMETGLLPVLLAALELEHDDLGALALRDDFLTFFTDAV